MATQSPTRKRLYEAIALTNAVVPRSPALLSPGKRAMKNPMDVGCTFYSPGLADAASYPPPRVPPLPYLNATSFVPRERAAPIFGAHRRLTNSGRAALARIVAELGLAPGARVLLPAYHCPSMVEPFRQAGADLHFYPLTSNLVPEPRAFASLIEKGATLALFVNFFGLRPDHSAVISAARAAGACIVHDCAHALYALDEVPDSDFAIASLTKFLPVEEGGLLQYPRDREPHTQGSPSAFGSGITCISRALARRSAARTARRQTLAPIPRLTLPAAVQAPAAPGTHFDAGRARRQPSLWTMMLLRLCADSAAARRRRANYAALLAHTATLRGLRPLWPVLPANAVPYVFPVLLQHGAEQFHLLRSAGLPIYRWEQLASSECSTAQHYREALVQLPCHQDLLPDDLRFIMHALNHASFAHNGR